MSERPLRWAFAGGGTGGHVTPALALAERVQAEGDEVRIFGSEQGLEKRMVPEAGFELVTFGSRQVVGRGPLQRVASLFGVARACLAAVRSFGRWRPDVVVSVGGYAAVPAVAAAVARRIPLALIEPNAEPGRANVLSARFARRVFCAFPSGEAAFLGRVAPERVLSPGIPLRRGMADAAAAAKGRKPAPPFHLLVFGGSQGARQINEALMALAAELRSLPLEIVHQTGEADRERVAETYAAADLGAEVIAFEPDMPARYAWADLALCRAGALTLAELALAGLPSLLVPYPYAAGDHQAANARDVEAAGAGRMLDPRPLDPQALLGTLRELTDDPAALERMGSAAAGLARPDAARDVIAECRRMVEAA